MCEYDHQSVTIPKVLALDVLNKLKEQEEQIKIKTENFNRLVAKIEVMPEVVRCKDCVFRDNRDGMCEHVQQVRGPDWFCADGKRR